MSVVTVEVSLNISKVSMRSETSALRLLRANLLHFPSLERFRSLWNSYVVCAVLLIPSFSRVLHLPVGNIRFLSVPRPLLSCLQPLLNVPFVKHGRVFPSLKWNKWEVGSSRARLGSPVNINLA